MFGLFGRKIGIFYGDDFQFRECCHFSSHLTISDQGAVGELASDRGLVGGAAGKKNG